MMNFGITDRRKNPSGKSLGNRKRFIDRVKKNIDVSKGLKERKISDTGDQEVTINKDGIEEHHFHYDRKKGNWDYLLPGNKKYNVGDGIPRPDGSSGGKGNQGSTDGDGEDDFRFAISQQEYLDILLGDLELPDMVKDSEKHTMSFTMKRSGYTTTGAASSLALEQSMIRSIGRRMALKTPKLFLIAELEEELENETDENRRLEIQEQIDELRSRANAIPFLDKTDLRYHSTIKLPLPITQCVMYCCMDVSGSMSEQMKDLSKRFYILLYIFLKRVYKNVEVVFVRHTHEASIVDEDTFFHSTETGGTIVSTAYDVVKKDIVKRFPVDDWNIYIAQASDGDNSYSDNEVAKKILADLMPWVQYMTYIEVGKPYSETSVWTMMEQMATLYAEKIALRKIQSKEEVVPVFRSLFAKKG